MFKIKNSLYIISFLLALSVSVWAALPTGDNEDAGMDQMGLMKADGTYAIRITSSGHYTPGNDEAVDLGTPILNIRDAYIGRRLYVVSDGNLNYGTAVTTAIAANTTIPVTGGYIVLGATGATGFRMTSTPNISTSTAVDGDVLTVFGSTTSGGPIFTLRDRLLIVNSGLALGTTEFALGTYDNITFIFDASTGAWKESARTNIQP